MVVPDVEFLAPKVGGAGGGLLQSSTLGILLQPVEPNVCHEESPL